MQKEKTIGLCMKGPRLFWLLLAMCFSLGVFAQKTTVKGHITDSSGYEVIGANIIEKGTSNGTVSDLDGNFTLTVNTRRPFWSSNTSVIKM